MITVKAEERKVTINIHSTIEKSSFWDLFEDEESEDETESKVKNVDELQKLLKVNKDASLIDIYINSAGGDVMEGIGIYNILKRNKAYKRVFIDGFACSIASVIAMAGNKITMPKSSMQMIHNAWTVAMGNASELRKVADDLDKINETIVNAYMSKFKGKQNELQALMDAESYLTADECLSYGLCTAIADDNEDTVENTNKALEQFTAQYGNKLEKLESIKAAVKDLLEAETVKDADDAEIVKDAEGNDMTPPENPATAGEDEVKDMVDEIKQTALQKMFGYVPKKGN